MRIFFGNKRVDLSMYAKEETGHRVANVEYKGSSLILKNTVSIRHYFNINDNIEKYTFMIDSQEVIPKVNDGMYYVEISNIPATSLAEPFICTISDGVNEHSIKYSAMSYCQKAISEPGDLGGLANSLYWYYKYAAELLDEDNL